MSFLTEPFILIVFTFPSLTFILSFVVSLLINGKLKFIVVPLVFFTYTIVTFKAFKETIFMYCYIYSAISFISTVLAFVVEKRINIAHKNKLNIRSGT